ncbi:cytosine deaminase [Methylocapsa sp. S129]|uniref:cytosine deaminase n=1 Tax=Methylocapsa sp. S129 TaxID=1641869 RepID=UPI00131DBBD7|nr:cytosine deaminase [Methylocapsa sp. S129]
MNGFYSLARASRYALLHARIPRSLLAIAPGPIDREGFALVDVLIDAGRIGAIASAGAGFVGAEFPTLALGGAIVLPLFVDAHTHLDKGHIWPRAANPDGTFGGALETVLADRSAHWSAGDVAARMEFGLRCAYAHGTRAIRTHIDSIGPQIAISWPVFAEARERWRGRIDLQGSPLFLIEHAFDEAHMHAIEAMVDAHGSRLLGAVTIMIPRLREALDILFRLAARKGFDLDFHVDETADPAAISLGVIAQAALDHRFAGRILVGHCCSLSRQDEEHVKRTIDLVARAGLSVVSLPMCNLYLQDRRGAGTPRWRGVTALHELKAAGVNAMIASDNTRDPFYAYGDLDMMEVWREGARILHLDHPAEPWAPALFTAPARALGLDAGALEVGKPADMILTRARSFTELFARPQSDRTVLRAGAPLNAALPDYAGLDRLEGLRP